MTQYKKILLQYGHSAVCCIGAPHKRKKNPDLISQAERNQDPTLILKAN